MQATVALALALSPLLAAAPPPAAHRAAPPATVQAVAPSVRTPLTPVPVSAADDTAWGYIDPGGHLVIQPAWERASPFSEGLAAVMKDARWGFIDREGREVVPRRFDKVGPFSEGLAAARIGSRWCYIDGTGTCVLRFDTLAPGERLGEREGGPLGNFSEGTAAVTIVREPLSAGPKTNAVRLVRWIDRRGSTVLEVPGDGGPFRGGFAVWRRDDGITLILDRTGEVVKQDVHAVKDRFSEGLLPVCQPGVQSGCGFVDVRGEPVGKARFDEVASFSGGLAAVTVGDAVGFVDHAGVLVIKATWDEARPFTWGLAAVRRGVRWGFIDRRGRIVVAPTLQDARPFHNKLAEVRDTTGQRWIARDGTEAYRDRGE